MPFRFLCEYIGSEILSKTNSQNLKRIKKIDELYTETMQLRRAQFSKYSIALRGTTSTIALHVLGVRYYESKTNLVEINW